MSSVFLTIRGEEHEVKYQDHGYEWDTNAHEIDWEFVEPETAPKNLTAEEEEQIYIQLAEIGQECFPDDVM